MAIKQPGEAVAGILLYSAGIFLFAVNDALGKWLVAGYSVAELMALRAVGALLVLAPALVLARARLRGPHQAGLQALRVVFSMIDTFCFYFAVRELPLADVMAIYLAAPLIVVALSGPLLGERVSAGRWAAVLVGFAGVLVALHPTSAAFSLSALVALLGAFCFAIGVAVTRRLRGVPWQELVGVQVAGSGLFGAALAPVGWITPTPGDLALMFLVGIVSMGCFICITRALGMAPASRLAPLQYLSIVWAAVMGWLVWGDVPSAAVVAGSLVIVASGLIVARPERTVPIPAT